MMIMSIPRSVASSTDDTRGDPNLDDTLGIDTGLGGLADECVDHLALGCPFLLDCLSPVSLRRSRPRHLDDGEKEQPCVVCTGL